MRPIDADALIIKVRNLIEEYERRMPKWSKNDMLTSGRDIALKWGFKADGVEDVLKLIIDAPIIKAEPIKHGRWVCVETEPEKVWCDNCKTTYRSSDLLNIGADDEKVNFCPNCGRKMR